MANPVILERSDEMRMHEEGCLSIPEVTAEVERPVELVEERGPGSDHPVREGHAQGEYLRVKSSRRDVEPQRFCRFLDSLTAVGSDLGKLRRQFRREQAERPERDAGRKLGQRCRCEDGKRA